MHTFSEFVTRRMDVLGITQRNLPERLNPLLTGKGFSVSHATVPRWIETNRWKESAIGPLCQVMEKELVRIEGNTVLVRADGAEIGYTVEGWLKPNLSRTRPSGTVVGVVTTATKVADAEVKLDADFVRWTPEKREGFLAALAGIVGAGQPIRLLKEEDGCVKLTLRMTTEQFDRLRCAFDTGQLAHLSVTAIVGVDTPRATASRRREPKQYPMPSWPEDLLLIFLEKLFDPDNVRSAKWYSEHMKQMLDHFLEAARPDFPPEVWQAFLSTQIHGARRKSVAAQFGRSERTIGRYIRRVYRRLRVHAARALPGERPA